MYYPKSQIQTGFYSNNDLLVVSTNTLYIGPYFQTSDGQYYSGKEPNDGVNELLIRPEGGIDEPVHPSTLNRVTGANIEDPRYDEDNMTYTILSEQYGTSSPYYPISYYPIINSNYIADKEFTRYIVKKTNENLYTEVSPQNFLESINSSLYISFQLPWVISGDKEEVRQINAKQVVFIEKNLQINGLGKFLRFNYLQFYQG